MKKICGFFCALFLLALISESQQAIGATKAPEAKAAAHAKFEATLLSMTLGGSAYVLSFALAEIVNKNHPWLTISAAETKGPVANLVTVANEPAMRKNAFFFTQESSNSVARQGLAPFKAPYTGARAVASFAETTVLLVTLDRNIKSRAEMDGKRVMALTKGNPSAQLHEMLLTDIWALKGVRISNGTFDNIKDALLDGLIDVGSLAVNDNPGVGYIPIPSLNELMTSKDVYVVNVPPADVEALVKKSKIQVTSSTIPAQAISKKQPVAWQGYGQTNGWWADVEMSDEIVYEFTKAVYDHAEKFKDYHGDGRLMTKKTLSRVGVSEDLFHPGALKFYREKGIKPGIY